MTVIKIAGIPIGLECRFEYTEKYVKDYVTDEEPVFTVSASDAEIEREYEISGIRIPPEYAENVVMYRKIAERLSDFDAIVFHGAVLEYGGVAYAVYNYFSGGALYTVAAIGAAGITYLIALFALRTFTADDILALPMGKKLLKVCQKLHLVR